MQTMLRFPGDRIFNMECKCGYSKEFAIKTYAIVCTNCGRSYSCSPPIIGVYEGECACGYNKTFAVDSSETYICTNCGRRR
jgi:hypothetical protein